MDRAAFLRSLDFLRPLPPSVWDGNSIDGENDEDPYSGSTITPPTPNKNNAILLFDEPLFVASIEPRLYLDKRNSSLAENGADTTVSRKRGRGDDVATAEGSTVGPAFFHYNSHIAKEPETCDKDKVPVGDGKSHSTTEKVQDAMDVDPDNNIQQDDNTAGGQNNERLQMINSDPSLCTFEAAIMKKFPSSLLGGESLDDGAFDTPNRHENAEEIDSKALIFRFGNRFVFHVDESTILEVKYDAGSDFGVLDDGKSNDTNKGGDGTNESPPSKRQRNEGDTNSPHKDKSPTGTKHIPPSLIISFGTCTLRIFSLEDSTNGPKTDADTTRSSSRIWGTLAKTAETVESRLMNARSVMMQQFDIESRGRNGNQQSWKMAPPGSGLAFHSWPESLESSSFRAGTLQCKESVFLDEDWSCCLDKKSTIECPSSPVSPQKSSSPSKSGSSSTHFEHGQKEQSPSKNGSSQAHSAGDVDKNDNGAKHGASNDSSELTHESEKKAKEDDDQSAESRSLFSDDEEAKDKDQVKENGKKSHKKDVNHSDDDEIKKGEDDMDVDNENTNKQIWKHGLYNKYHLFETSSTYLEKAMDLSTVPSQSEQKSVKKSYLTSCAESLSGSYLTVNEFMTTAEKCENEIESTTSEMESVLDKMFPARGRKSQAVDSDQRGDFQDRIQELMKIRKEAVAAKLALLMTPKR